MTEQVKRKARTLEEREAALEAELAKVRSQQRLKDELAVGKLQDEIDKLLERRRVLTVKIDEKNTELRQVQSRLETAVSDE